MIRISIRAALVALVAGVLTACSGSISEPWVSGAQAEALAEERTRTDAQSDALRDRLARYGAAYQ